MESIIRVLSLNTTRVRSIRVVAWSFGSFIFAAAGLLDCFGALILGSGWGSPESSLP